jgi:predicted transcriptional regulator of viral defense system
VELEQILGQQRKFWRLADSMTTAMFIKFLLDETAMHEYRLEFPSRTEIRYTWGNVTSFEVALSLKQSCYFTHFTSVFLHGLTDQIPKTIYVNWEQPPKRFVDRELEQSRIDSAFKRKPRVSHNIAPLGDYRVCLLNGMHTSRLGVYDEVGPSGEAVVLTNLERTLIDITVRPFYSGGVFEVAKAFRAAKGEASINKIQAYLNQLNYVYPYHQVCISLPSSGRFLFGKGQLS